MQFGYQDVYHSFKIIEFFNCHHPTPKYLKEAVQSQSDCQAVGESSFLKIWKKYCGCINTMHPVDHLCDVCHENNFNIT